jgi:hypothetical protein
MNSNKNQSISQDYLSSTVQTSSSDSPSDYHQGECINTRAVGVSFGNRQQLIAKLEVGEEIILRREPQNTFDSHAIRLERKNGTQFGFINKYLAEELAPIFDAHGTPIKGVVSKLIGGFGPGYHRGVCISFSIPEPKTKGDDYAKAELDF